VIQKQNQTIDGLVHHPNSPLFLLLAKQLSNSSLTLSPLFG